MVEIKVLVVQINEWAWDITDRNNPCLYDKMDGCLSLSKSQIKEFFFDNGEDEDTGEEHVKILENKFNCTFKDN